VQAPGQISDELCELVLYLCGYPSILQVDAGELAIGHQLDDTGDVGLADIWVSKDVIDGDGALVIAAHDSGNQQSALGGVHLGGLASEGAVGLG